MATGANPPNTGASATGAAAAAENPQAQPVKEHQIKYEPMGDGRNQGGKCIVLHEEEVVLAGF